jgi:hypothetical protein
MANNPDNPPQTPQAPPDEGGGGSMVSPGDQEAWDQDTTPEAKDHMMAAFMHAAGLGPHPGKKPHKIARGPRAATDADIDRQREAEEPIAEAKEPGAKKMRAAQTAGASETGIGPTQAEQTLVKQQGALQQQAAAAGAQQATQAQGQQTSVAPPPAPTGPQGTTTPYSSQKGAVGGPGITQTPPPAAPAGPQAPEPGPEEPQES